MKNLTALAEKIYRLMLAVYPAAFRAEYRVEMLEVFSTELGDTGHNLFKSLVLLGREIRDWPGNVCQAYWDAWRHKEFKMDENFQKPKWFFYPEWVVLSTLAVILALGLTFWIITIINNQTGGYITVTGQQHNAEDYLFMYIFLPLLWLLTSLLQYLLLRSYFPKMGWWIIATGLGWVAVIVSLQVMNVLFSTGAFFNLGLPLGFSWIGALIGFCQWLFLRRRIPQAGWWILASTLGWGLAAIGTYTPVRNGSVLAQLSLAGFFPALITGLAWWFLLKPKRSPGSEVVA